MEAFVGFSAVNTIKDRVIPTAEFYPDISVKDFADSIRLDGTVTEPRMEFALRRAVIRVCKELKSWSTEQITSLAVVTLAEYDLLEETDHCFSFKDAVYNHAKASLTEHYRDYDTKRDTTARSKELDLQIDSCRRNVRNSIADIVGRSHSTIELI